MGKVLALNYFPASANGTAGLCPGELENPNISGSLASIMALYWRVRTIRFTCTLGDEGEQILTYRSQATEERDLVCQNIFAQASPNPFGVDADDFQYVVFTDGTQARILIFLEAPGAELFIGASAGDPLSFSIGSTGLSASIKWSGSENASLDSVECTEFWSYGGTYSTSNGSAF